MLGRSRASRVTVEYTGDDANGIIGNGCGCLPLIEVSLAILFIVGVLVVYWQ
jgi:hypothetical protein